MTSQISSPWPGVYCYPLERYFGYERTITFAYFIPALTALEFISTHYQTGGFLVAEKMSGLRVLKISVNDYTQEKNILNSLQLPSRDILVGYGLYIIQIQLVKAENIRRHLCNSEI